MKNFENIGIQIPDIVLPDSKIEINKWSVIACDQFTAQPGYWEEVEELVGDSPSTLRMTLPEVYLEAENLPERILATQKTMRAYLESELLVPFSGFILVERTIGGKTRTGLMVSLDLEKYDFSKGSQTLIRATEGTILERIPPRVKIREGASLEFPHIIVLIDDPEKTVIEPLLQFKPQLNVLYNSKLMFDSGHLSGYAIESEQLQNQIVSALEHLADPNLFQSKYRLQQPLGVLLFAMGDGNHSLATAKTIWEQQKSRVGMNHPSRYALVELENVHDEGLEFEPIHRVLFNIRCEMKTEMDSFWNGRYSITSGLTKEEMVQKVDAGDSETFLIGFIQNHQYHVIQLNDTVTNLPVGELQNFLDQLLLQYPTMKIDYVHGAEVTCSAGNRPGNCAFYLPAMEKNELFRTVILDGALPRKTFSMGAAHEKRFYLEGRKIK